MFAFVVWRMYLMACLLRLCSCNLVCWELFSLLCVIVWNPQQEAVERHWEFYWCSPHQVCFCAITFILKSPSCWSSGIRGISVEIWYRLAVKYWDTDEECICGCRHVCEHADGKSCSIAASPRENPKRPENYLNDRAWLLFWHFTHSETPVAFFSHIYSVVHTLKGNFTLITKNKHIYILISSHLESTNRAETLWRCPIYLILT